MVNSNLMVSKLQRIYQACLSIDFLGHKPTLLVEGRTRYKSIRGALLTISMIFVIMACVAYNLYLVIDTTKPSVTYNLSSVERNELMQTWDMNYFPTFFVEYKKQLLNITEMSKYFTVVAVHISFKYDFNEDTGVIDSSNPSYFNQSILSVVQCKDFHKRDELEKYYSSTDDEAKRLMLNYGMCMQPGEGQTSAQLDLEGKLTQVPLKQLTYFIYRCNPIANPTVCQSATFDASKSRFFYKLPKNSVNYSSIDKPFSYKTETNSFSLSQSIHTFIRVFLRKVQISDNREAELYDDSPPVISLTTDKIEPEIKVTAANFSTPLVTIEFNSAQNKEFIRREYFGMINFFTQIGGLIGVTYTIFAITYWLVGRNLLTDNLSKSVFGNQKKPLRDEVDQGSDFIAIAKQTDENAILSVAVDRYLQKVDDSLKGSTNVNDAGDIKGENIHSIRQRIINQTEYKNDLEKLVTDRMRDVLVKEKFL